MGSLNNINIEIIGKNRRSINRTVYAYFKTMDAVVDKNYAYTLFTNGEEMLFDHRIDPEEKIHHITY